MRMSWNQTGTHQVCAPDIEQTEGGDGQTSRNKGKEPTPEGRWIANDLYVTHINGNLISIKINDNYYETSAIWKDEDLFNELIQKERIEYKYFNSYSIYTSHTNIRFSEIEKKIDPKTSYAQRLAAITTKDKDLAREE